MTARPRDIGTAAETAVVRHLTAHGFPHAERRSLKGNLDQGDVTGTLGICWEIKGGKAAKTASDGQITKWLDETETERCNAGADVGILVVARAGVGAGNAGRWWAIMPLGTLHGLMQAELLDQEAVEWVTSEGPAVRLHLFEAVDLLRAAGYGDPLPQVKAPVHNHGAEDGPGLGCQELRQPDGSLRGTCMTGVPA